MSRLSAICIMSSEPQIHGTNIFFKTCFHQQMISKTLNLPIVEVYILYYVVEISLIFSLFCCFERHIKLHFSNWQCVGAKMLRSLLENAPSIIRRVRHVLYCQKAQSPYYTRTYFMRDFRSERNANEFFLKVLTASAAPWHQSAAVIGQLTQLPTVVTCLSKLTRFTLEISYFTKFILISVKQMIYYI